MKKTKHWLHILLALFTGGLWLPVYVICVATTEMFNRGYREGKAAGRVERQNEIDEEQAFDKVRAKQAAWNALQDRIGNVQPVKTTRIDRFAELCKMARAGGSWTVDNEIEYQELRKELNQ